MAENESVNNQSQESESFVGKRRGSMLEEHVERIFQAAGFDVKRNVYVSGFEIDVYATFGDRRFVIECKQYESSCLSVSNLIFEWSGKNEAIKADKLIFVLYGVGITEETRVLAVQKNILLWGIDIISTFLGLINSKDLHSASFAGVSGAIFCNSP